MPRYFALGILYSAHVYYRIGDFKTVQDHIAKAFAIAEKNGDEEVLARIQNFRSFIESDPSKRVLYLRKAIQYKKALTTLDPLSTIYLGNFSGALLDNNQIDSAFFYAQKMVEHSIKTNDTLSSYLNIRMGNVYLKMSQPEIAYVFYKKGIKVALKTLRISDIISAYLSMAYYFNKMNQTDSALYYWKKPFEYDPKETFLSRFSTSRKIYDYYFKKGNNDSAVKYINIYIVANDSINSNKKVVQLQIAKLDYELNQQELEKTKEEEKENRKHNMQLVITAIAILTTVILFLLLSRSILVSHKVVGFLSVLVLLVVFEFINLLIHPFLERITHHSPVLMLLGLVAIASMIIPLHHRLEHWTTKILVEKNKAVRLANAKKTIEELEKNNIV